MTPAPPDKKVLKTTCIMIKTQIDPVPHLESGTATKQPRTAEDIQGEEFKMLPAEI